MFNKGKQIKTVNHPSKHIVSVPARCVEDLVPDEHLEAFPVISVGVIVPKAREAKDMSSNEAKPPGLSVSLPSLVRTM
jgi:hypothetical protein